MDQNIVRKNSNLPHIYTDGTRRNYNNSDGKYRTEKYSLNNGLSLNGNGLFKDTYSLNHILAIQSSKDFAAISPHLERVSFENEEIIYQHGDEINYVYFPENSVVSEYQILDDGRTTEVAMIGKEGVAGLEVVLNSGSANSWMRASMAGNAVRIKAKVFKDEFNYNDRFRKVVLSYINYYIEQTSQRIICNCYHLAEKRFCSWLLMLYDRSERKRIYITHEQISQFIGTQRATISRIIQLLRNNTIIKSTRGSIVILDRSGLEEMACSCYEPMGKVFAN